MSDKYVFHCTAKGYSHIMSDTVCEDSSGSYEDDEKRYHIVAIADGHGDSTCFRSEKGSKFAVEAAVSVMKAFAEEILEEERFVKQFLEEAVYQKNRVRALTNEVYYQWEKAVSNDYNESHPTEEELEQHGYSADDEPFHIYGTTLIAALWLSQCLVMIHQGDGRCEVIYSDGTMDQPVPWDDRCFEEKTTSLCNLDVLSSFRYCVIDLNQRIPVACYVCSDGVEDSYRDTYKNMRGVHAFFKDLTCQILERTDSFQSILPDILDEVSKSGRFSKGGSGDDVSVAGIVDMDGIQPLKEQFTVDVRKYELAEELFWKEDELRGKTRKHGILLKRMNEAKAKVDYINNEIHNLTTEQDDMVSKSEVIRQQIVQAKNDLDDFTQRIGEGASIIEQNLMKNGSCKSRTPVWERIQQTFRKNFDDGQNQLEIQYMKLSEDLETIEAKIKNIQQDHQKLTEDLQSATEVYHEAKVNFDEYNTKYQEIEAEIKKISNEIAADC